MAEKKRRKLSCPGCGRALREALVEANYGRVVMVDQCPGCGGVWFDKWELFMVKTSSVETLAGVDEKSFAAPVPNAGKEGAQLACPRCSSPLVDMNDPVMPPDSEIDRCPGCMGLWLNRGSLEKYASHRKEKAAAMDEARGKPPADGNAATFAAAEAPDPPGDADGAGAPAIPPAVPVIPFVSSATLGGLAAVPAADPGGDPGGDRVEALKKLQKELDAGTLVSTAVPASALDDEPLDGREFARDAGLVILQALVRLIFKF